jgi:hypothetical protein
MGFVEESKMNRTVVFVLLNSCLSLQKMKREGGLVVVCVVEKNLRRERERGVVVW